MADQLTAVLKITTRPVAVKPIGSNLGLALSVLVALRMAVALVEAVGPTLRAVLP